MRQPFSNHPHSSSDWPLNELTLGFKTLDSETGEKFLPSQEETVEPDLSLDMVLDSLSSTESSDDLREDNTDLSLENDQSEEKEIKPDLLLNTVQDSLSPTESSDDLREDNTDLSLDKVESQNNEIKLDSTLDNVLDSLISEELTDGLNEDNPELSLENAEAEENKAEIEVSSLENMEEQPSVQEDIPPETDWFELACKLRGQNQELIQTVVALEQALAQARQDIQEQKQYAAKIEQPLTYTPQPQSPITIGEIDCLKEENQGLKEQIAELERECAVLKEENQEKSHQLATSEGHVRELHSRLQRQQRYTLQYKAALEQHLGESWNNTPDTAIDEDSQDLSIQPWSKEQLTANTATPNPEESTATPQEPSIPVDVPPRSPSFQMNLSKIANRYGSPEPSKSRSSHGIIDLPDFLRRRSR